MEPETYCVVLRDNPAGAELKTGDIVIFESNFARYNPELGSWVSEAFGYGHWWLIPHDSIKPLTQKDLVLA